MEELKDTIVACAKAIDNPMVIAVNGMYVLIGVIGVVLYGPDLFQGIKLKFFSK